ncbi:nucleotidyltransferase domain-containing protein [Amaricoccus macauensis]|uniref:nucleotidyltransferase domain-containing protein n=1 Tax=Amaricoccus macauensis TaxID=57001 RepID=UPI003C7CC1C8
MKPIEIAQHILANRHPEAVAAYWAGSLARGDGTPTSDIDLVVIHARLANAWRDSFILENRLCETFVHDPHSLRVFFAQDAERGVPSLMHMIAEGIPLIEGAISAQLQADASLGLAAGPRAWTPDEVDRSRYTAGDLLDDLGGASDPAEIRAIGASLFSYAFNHHRRINGKWSATGKHIVRTLRQEEGTLGVDYLSAFETLFITADPVDAIQVVRDIYASCGGPLAEWRNDAPPHA